MTDAAKPAEKASTPAANDGGITGRNTPELEATAQRHADAIAKGAKTAVDTAVDLYNSAKNGFAAATEASKANPADATAAAKAKEAETKVKDAEKKLAQTKLEEAQKQYDEAARYAVAHPGDAIAQKRMETAKSALTAAQEAVGGTAAPAGGGFMDGLKNMFGGLTTGKVAGGLLAGVGAWLLGGFFGEGIMGTILSVGLGILLLPMGMKFGSETIDGWLGNKKEAPQKAQGHQVQHDGLPYKITEVRVAGPEITRLVAEATAKAESVTHLQMHKDTPDGTVAFRTITDDGVRRGEPGVTSVREMRNILAKCGAQADTCSVAFNAVGDGFVMNPLPVTSTTGRNR